MGTEMRTWVIYSPGEGRFSHRAVEWVTTSEGMRQGEGTAYGPLDMLRGLFRQSGFTQMDRNENDAENIVEMWI
jgi:hypothetical protein